MNRKNDLSETMTRSYITATKKMNREDRVAFYQATIDADEETERRILKKYGYFMVTPIEESVSDVEAEEFANSLLKHGVEGYTQINDLMESIASSQWGEAKRLCDVSLEDPHGVVNKAYALEDGFYSKQGINNTLNAFHGENTTLILKAAMIADTIGCLKLRNELMVFYNSMICDAQNSKAINIFKRKKVISEERSAAKKGKTNRHQTEALRIASGTWDKYPHASLAGVSEEITAHLRKSWNDVPVVGTITTWLKASGLYPDAKPKNRHFELVLNKGEEI